MPNIIRQGDSGPDVASLQQRLVELGYSLAADELQNAFFGPTTNADVLVAQKLAHISADGVVGPVTRAALETSMAGPTPLDWKFDIDNARPEVKPALALAWSDLRRPTIEIPPGSNRGPRIDAYWPPGATDPGPGDAWCAAAASAWVRACMPDPIGKLLASSYKWHEWAVANHALVENGNGTTVIPGDVGLLLTPTAHHVELVVANLGDGRLANIGGNVGNAVSATVRPRSFFTFIVRPVRIAL